MDGRSKGRPPEPVRLVKDWREQSQSRRQKGESNRRALPDRYDLAGLARQTAQMMEQNGHSRQLRAAPYAESPQFCDPERRTSWI
mmetsp:Transcript_31990/g.67059  ORF Transcript_31990/g.67059 Transcript_31990/m.67059 type:complete len:85 (+) Transcript_31990:364-618(+)